MDGFKYNVSRDRIDCFWTWGGLEKSRSFSLGELKSTPDLTDNAVLYFEQDEGGDLVDTARNLVMENYRNNSPDSVLHFIYSTIRSDGLFILFPFRSGDSLAGSGAWCGGGQLPQFFRHWYQPIILTDCIIPVGQPMKSVQVRAIANNEFTKQTCHMIARLRNAKGMKDCSELIGTQTFDVQEEYTLNINSSNMKHGDTYVLSVSSEYCLSRAGMATSTNILRVRGDV